MVSVNVKQVPAPINESLLHTLFHCIFKFFFYSHEISISTSNDLCLISDGGNPGVFEKYVVSNGHSGDLPDWGWYQFSTMEAHLGQNRNFLTSPQRGIV